MSMQITKETLFLHGYFPTSKARGFRHDFHVLAPSFFGYFAVRFLGDFQAICLALCGWLGLERLGAQLPNVQVCLFVVSMLIASSSTRPSEGDYSVIPHLYFSAMQGGALRYQLRGQWLLATFWISSFLIALGAALVPIAPEPAVFILSLGAPWFAAAAAIRAFAWWTARAARRSIAEDLRYYETLWALVLDDPASRAAADHLEALLTAEAARRTLPGGPPAAAWDLVFSRTRQVLPPPPPGRLAGLLGGRLAGLLGVAQSFGVLRDLEALYSQAESVYGPFRRKIFALARATGAYLPVAPGSRIGRGEGLELAAAAAAAAGVARSGSCDSEEYCQAWPGAEAGDFRWAQLKGAERALEKVRRSGAGEGGGGAGDPPPELVSLASHIGCMRAYVSAHIFIRVDNFK